MLFFVPKPFVSVLFFINQVQGATSLSECKVAAFDIGSYLLPQAGTSTTVRVTDDCISAAQGPGWGHGALDTIIDTSGIRWTLVEPCVLSRLPPWDDKIMLSG